MSAPTPRVYLSRMAARLLAVAELPLLLAVPVAMLALAYLQVQATAGLLLLVVLLVLALFGAGFESSRPGLRQIMPAATLGAVAAVGRILFAPVPDVKPVSAIVIVAGATLGRRGGFVVGALAALVSNFFFGQGAWTPLQMYAWGLVGYLSGALADAGWLERAAVRTTWAFASGLLYGAILNGWYVLGYVRPLEPAPILAAFAAGLPLDALHGVATVVFLALIWRPWTRAIGRVVAKYGLA